MGRLYDGIDDDLRAFIDAQHVFFVGTAPLAANGHVNISPKGLNTLRVIGRRTLIYLDYVGSGAETIAHVRENGRIVIMVCAFQGPPQIVRMHGAGEVLEPNDPGYAELRELFTAEPPARSIVRIAIDRISDSCGYGVPLHAYQGERTQLSAWAARKGDQGLREYQEEKNGASIDGLPALRWLTSEAP